MTQKTLDFDTVPHNRTETSKAGAATVAPRAGTQAAIVLALIKGQGERGATNNEIQAATGFPINVVCGRVGALKKNGLIRLGGKRKCPATGVDNQFWVAR